jgi:cysteine desulfurase
LHGREKEVGKLLALLDNEGVAVSAGSACGANHAGQPSNVLLAMGYDAEQARGLIRVSLGRFNTEEEVDRFLRILVSSTGKLKNAMPERAISPTVTAPALA